MSEILDLKIEVIAYKAENTKLREALEGINTLACDALEPVEETK